MFFPLGNTFIGIKFRIGSVGVVFLPWQELNGLNPTKDPAFSPLLAGDHIVAIFTTGMISEQSIISSDECQEFAGHHTEVCAQWKFNNGLL